MKIKILPVKVHKTYFIAEDLLCLVPQIDINKYIGTNSANQKNKNKTAGAGETDITPPHRKDYETGRSGVELYNNTI